MGRSGQVPESRRPTRIGMAAWCSVTSRPEEGVRRFARGAGHQPTAEPETSGARIWCTATRLRIAAGPCTALAERLD